MTHHLNARCTICTEHTTGYIADKWVDAMMMSHLDQQANVVVRHIQRYLGPAPESRNIYVTADFRWTVVNRSTTGQVSRTDAFRHTHRLLVEGLSAIPIYPYHPARAFEIEQDLRAWFAANPPPRTDPRSTGRPRPLGRLEQKPLLHPR
jgi:hypothetical protein